MRRLIHLNGPPGIGKSTLAAMYADRHPGTLDLDIDRLHPLIGGWRDPEQDTHTIVRPVALAMAAAHLGGGRDVVMPQTVGRLDEIERFEQVAQDEAAEFRELVLLDDRAAAIARFDRRTGQGDWETNNREVVDAMGGAAWLGALYDQLLGVVDRRPDAVVVHSELAAVEQTYAAMMRALEGPRD